MAKERSFAAKIAKSHAVSTNVCPVCGVAKSSVHYVKGMKNDEKGSWRFKERYVAVCKCNEKEIYG